MAVSLSPPTLIIAGGDGDPQLMRLLKRALTRDVRVRALLHGDSGAPELVWDLESDELRDEHGPIIAEAAFVRQDVFRFLKTGKEIDRAAASSWKRSFDGWLWAHPRIRIFNRGFALRDAVNKPLALIWAKEAGLPIPKTTLHASKAWAEKMAAETGSHIYKPVGGGAHARPVIADELEKVHTHHLPHPYIFQARLVPPELRLFRVGDRFFAFHVEADTLDYRDDKKARVKEADTPEHLAHGLRTLTDRLGLTYAAADFKTDPESGDLLFLEVNSNPMFAAFDQASRGQLIDAMLDYLLEPVEEVGETPIPFSKSA